MIMAWASEGDFMSSMEEIRTEILPGWLLPRERISGSWEEERIRDVTFQLRERSLGVMRRETLPWPPRRRMFFGGMVDGVRGIGFEGGVRGLWLFLKLLFKSDV